MKGIAWKKLAAATLLLTFFIGQAIVYTHSHEPAISHTAADNQTKKQYTDDLRCPICHQSANPLFLFHFEHITQPLPVAEVEFTLPTPANANIRPLISINRGPPAC